jgi:hypothetical protein
VAAAAATVGSRHGAFQVKRSDGTVADPAARLSGAAFRRPRQARLCQLRRWSADVLAAWSSQAHARWASPATGSRWLPT